jgi:hypothetical protein
LSFTKASDRLGIITTMSRIASVLAEILCLLRRDARPRVASAVLFRLGKLVFMNNLPVRPLGTNPR